MIKYAHQYVDSAVAICELYDGSMPLAFFLKQYFQQNKKFGSRDRRYISHLCYCNYRLGHALKEHNATERIKTALFLCEEQAGEWQVLFDANWLDHWSENITRRINFIQSIYPSFSVESVFPWTDQLSGGIEPHDFILSHFIQPDLFIRIRPGKEKLVTQKLNDQQLQFEQLSATCIALPNASKINTIIEIDKEAVIQDYSSQQIAEFLQLITYNLSLTTSVWDCCAASGGKSILAYDTLSKIELTVSDIRPSILQNLKKRFELAGIKNYHSFIADLASQFPNFPISKSKIILCDAPCTGSGTWSRTPEQLYFFSKEKIDEYAALQKKIVRNVIHNLMADGYLLYITCSAFKKENEDMVTMIEKEFSLQLVKSEVLKGYSLKSDSMFAALFKKVNE